jgi:hypothetical protein
MTEIEARWPGRTVVCNVVNEGDPWLAVDPGTRVSEMADFVAAMKAAAVSAFGPGVACAASFRYHCVKDGTFASNGYAAVALAGSYPTFTYYPVDPTTYAIYDFTDPLTGMGKDFENMILATGAPLAFAVKEMGCPSAPSLTVGFGAAAQEEFYQTFFSSIATPYRAYLQYVTFFRMTDLSQTVLTNIGYVEPLLSFEGSLGLRKSNGAPKAAYDDVVAFLEGALDATPVLTVRVKDDPRVVRVRPEPSVRVA